MVQKQEEKAMDLLKKKLAYSEKGGLEIFMDQLMAAERNGQPWPIHKGQFEVIVIHRNLSLFQKPLSSDARDRALQALSREKEIQQMVASQVPQLTTMRYSDQDLVEFCAAVPAQEKRYLSRFLGQLYEQGQIALDQYDRVLASEGLEKATACATQEKDQATLEQDLFIRVVLYCLEHCMHSGSRLGAFLRVSNYEEARFFDQVITNIDVDYFEEVLEVGKSPASPSTSEIESLLMMRLCRK